MPENQPIWNRPAEQPPPGPGGPSWQPPGPGGPPAPPPPGGPSQQPPPRKRRKWPWITGGILAGLVVLFVVAGILAGTSTGTKQASSPAAPSAPPAPAGPVSSSPTPSPASNVAQVGDTMTITQDDQDAADITITRVNVTTQPADPEFGEAPQNGYYVTARVRIKIKDDFTGGSTSTRATSTPSTAPTTSMRAMATPSRPPAATRIWASPTSAPARPRAARWCSTCPPRTAGSPPRPT